MKRSSTDRVAYSDIGNRPRPSIVGITLLAQHAANLFDGLPLPKVELTTEEYSKGVRRRKAEMKKLEPWLERTTGLEKWAVLIQPPPVVQLII